jgi:hypothetical protein
MQGSIVILVCLFVAIASAAVAEPGAGQQGGGRLDGTWDVVLTPYNCSTGAPFNSIRELATFSVGGTVVASTAGLSPATKTPGHGVWSHVSGRAYAYTYKFFRFDASGAAIGWAIVHQDAALDSSGDNYTSQGGIDFYNNTGAYLFSGCSTTTATRFQ